MIKFPEEFVEIHVPGYFWSKKEQKLYSIKSGQLKILAGPSNLTTIHGYFTGWIVSHLGERVWLTFESLAKLNDHNQDYELPVIRQVNKKKKPETKYYQTANQRRQWTNHNHRYH
jgi:hypothetical protein